LVRHCLTHWSISSPNSKPYEEKSWHFDPQTKAKRIAKDKIYELVEATDQDKRKVIEFYQQVQNQLQDQILTSDLKVSLPFKQPMEYSKIETVTSNSLNL
jgi:hypothetical protein